MSNWNRLMCGCKSSTWGFVMQSGFNIYRVPGILKNWGQHQKFILKNISVVH